MKPRRLTANLLSVYDVAAALGVSCSTIYQWSAEGIMPAPVKFGGRRRWLLTDIQRWADAGFPHQQISSEQSPKAKA